MVKKIIGDTMPTLFPSAHNSYIDPDKNISVWSDEAFEIKVSAKLSEGEIIDIGGCFFEVIDKFDDDNYLITDTLKKEADQTCEEDEVTFL